eukprot:1937843-Pleurochrysis_carterae.AAC.2
MGGVVLFLVVLATRRCSLRAGVRARHPRPTSERSPSCCRRARAAFIPYLLPSSSSQRGLSGNLASAISPTFANAPARSRCMLSSYIASGLRF